MQFKVALIKYEKIVVVEIMKCFKLYILKHVFYLIYENNKLLFEANAVVNIIKYNMQI